MTRRVMRWLTVLLGALPGALAVADEALWARLQSEPNMVVLMRHTEAAGGHPLVWDERGACQGETVLNDKGRSHARKIGLEFSARGIKPSVISSPLCRCQETARLAFGGPPITHPELREMGGTHAAGPQVFVQRAQAMLASKRGAAPVVLVNHRPNIDQLAMELIGFGELLVGQINALGEIDLLGKITVAQ